MKALTESDTAAEAAMRVRPYAAADRAFVLGLAERFVAFPLPAWRTADSAVAGIHADLSQHLDAPPAHSHLFMAEDADAQPVGFLHLKKERDFFSGQWNGHISDLVVAPGHEGHGYGVALLAFAERWAAENGCSLMTLNVFPGNARALALYRRRGYDTDLLRLARPLKPVPPTR